MTFEEALRLSEILVGIAVIQRGAEHIATGERWLFAPQLGSGVLLLVGFVPTAAITALWVLGLAQLMRFQGPYNGGADKMLLLIITCLMVSHMAPDDWAHLALSYLAVQLVLSYFISGWVKLRNPDWRSGRALSDVFAFSAYPVSEDLRRLSCNMTMLRVASVGVIGFELAFPLALVHPALLVIALGTASLFHLANAFLFGLNRFFWAWVAAFPSLIWFQGRIVG